MIAPSLFEVDNENVCPLSLCSRKAAYALEENFSYSLNVGCSCDENLQWHQPCACAIPSNMEKLIESGDDDRAPSSVLNNFSCTHIHTHTLACTHTHGNELKHYEK